MTVKSLQRQVEEMRRERDRYRNELENIVKARPDTWGEESDQFQAWAQNRARFALNPTHDKAD